MKFNDIYSKQGACIFIKNNGMSICFHHSVETTMDLIFVAVFLLYNDIFYWVICIILSCLNATFAF